MLHFNGERGEYQATAGSHWLGYREALRFKSLTCDEAAEAVNLSFMGSFD